MGSSDRLLVEPEANDCVIQFAVGVLAMSNILPESFNGRLPIGAIK